MVGGGVLGVTVGGQSLWVVLIGVARCFFVTDTATTGIDTLSLHVARPNWFYCF